jgi:hypothetical protein
MKIREGLLFYERTIEEQFRQDSFAASIAGAELKGSPL